MSDSADVQLARRVRVLRLNALDRERHLAGRARDREGQALATVAEFELSRDASQQDIASISELVGQGGMPVYGNELIGAAQGRIVYADARIASATERRATERAKAIGHESEVARLDAEILQLDAVIGD